MRFIPGFAVVYVLLAGLALAQADVTVVVDMTPEGRTYTHPTVQNPAYYLPVMRGYVNYGTLRKDEVIPTGHDIVKAVAPELAKQGYLATDDPAKASLIVDFSWGRIGKIGKDEHNAAQRDSLVIGGTAFDIAAPESFGHSQFLAAANQHRVFIVITAFDPKVLNADKKHLVVWQAKMSIPEAGLNFIDIVPALAQAGGPQFGYETSGHPILVQNPTIQTGHVDVGPVTEKK